MVNVPSNGNPSGLSLRENEMTNEWMVPIRLWSASENILIQPPICAPVRSRFEALSLLI